MGPKTENIISLPLKHPKRHEKYIPYGTAGFRTNSCDLEHVMFRVGLLSVLYANYTKKTSGIMITASHNPENDNGVKIIGKDGEMLEEKWEISATELANCKDNQITSNINQIIKDYNIDVISSTYHVFLAHDTRKSCPDFVNACIDGIEALSGSYINYGLLTTPQLHFMVSASNNPEAFHLHHVPPTENDYFDKLVGAFEKFLWTCNHHRQLPSTSSNDPSKSENKSGSKKHSSICLTIDAANGVGAPKMKCLSQLLAFKCNDVLPLPIDIAIANARIPQTFFQEDHDVHHCQESEHAKNGTCNAECKSRSGIGGDVPVKNLYQSETIDTKALEHGLNEDCGADYVKVNHKAPLGIKALSSTPEKEYQYVSFDGDADRIVFYYFDRNGQFKLLDGDKMATLIAHFIKDVLKICGIDEQEFKMGVVQTAYANGSSTYYIKHTLKMDVYFTPTGVKYLHHQASELDIGVYFEANGHGTVLYSTKFVDRMNALSQDESQSMEVKNAALSMLYFIQLTNQSVGDALSDLLLIESILLKYEWDMVTWDGMYRDLPNRQMKMKIKDRSVIKTNYNETQCLSPSGLQSEIDKLVGNFGQNARAFIRPSGTEDIVRVYAEASTQKEADGLAHAICLKAYEMAGGVGDLPMHPAN